MPLKAAGTLPVPTPSAPTTLPNSVGLVPRDNWTAALVEVFGIIHPIASTLIRFTVAVGVMATWVFVWTFAVEVAVVVVVAVA